MYAESRGELSAGIRSAQIEPKRDEEIEGYYIVSARHDFRRGYRDFAMLQEVMQIEGKETRCNKEVDNTTIRPDSCCSTCRGSKERKGPL